MSRPTHLHAVTPAPEPEPPPRAGAKVDIPNTVSIRVTVLAATLRRAQGICASRAVPPALYEELDRLLAEAERDLPLARAAL